MSADPVAHLRTGVFLTEDEAAAVETLAARASSTPVITFGGGGPDAASVAWSVVKQTCHRFALAHGLPEIPGYYGCDLESREVLKS